MAGPFFTELSQALGDPTAAASRTVGEETATATAKRLRVLLESVRESLRVAGPAGDFVRDALERLQRVSAAYDEPGMETVAEQTYGATGAMRADLDLLLAQDAAPSDTARLLEMQSYVRRASVPELDPDITQHELAIDRRLLLQRLSPSVALDAPHQIDEIEAGFDIFRGRYIDLYVRRHRAYHDIVMAWRRQFNEEHAAYLQALHLLNEIPGLGPAVGSDLDPRAQAILASTPECGTSDDEVRAALAQEPRCPTCELDLMASPPSAELALWHDDCLTALRLQKRRLARAAVARAAVANGADPAIDRFLRAVQASDVGPLVEILDDDMQALVREMMEA